MVHLPRIAIVLLASGASSRMQGRDKLLENIDGEALLRRTAKACLASNARLVITILRPDDHARRAVLDGLDLTQITNPTWQDGMAAGISRGLKNLPADCQGVIIALADMPDVSANDFNALIDAFHPNSRMICRAATQADLPGHPVLFDKSYFAQLAAQKGDKGGKDILKANAAAVKLIKTTGDAALTDLDTPEDWRAYRQS